MGKQRGHKWFAAFYDKMVASAEPSYMDMARSEVVGGAAGKILEIGAGTGANFLYYSDDTSGVIAIDPDPYMLRRAVPRLNGSKSLISVHRARAEELPYRDASFDTVVSTLVLCSVQDPSKALSEIRRVLKPGGKFRFCEHVRYGHSLGSFFQDLVTPAWQWFGAGCHPNRNTAKLIRDAGFLLQDLKESKPLLPLPPMSFVRPHIRGVATFP